MNQQAIETLREMKEWIFFHQAGDKVIYVISIFITLAVISVFISKKYKIPIVVGYVFLGILFSVNVFERLPFLSEEQIEWYTYTVESFDYLSHLALGFIAFTIGSELSIRLIKKLGKSITYIVLIQALGAFLLVCLAILAFGQPLYLALVLGSIATATAPAATVMVLREYNAEGLLTSMILAVVAIDDALALIVFSLIKPLALIQFNGQGHLSLEHALLWPLIEIVGSILLGITIGYLSQKIIINNEEKTKKVLILVATIIIGIAFSIMFKLSPLITNMAIGFAYRNFARKNLGVGDYMDTLTIPLYAMFFILAGTEIRFSHMTSRTFIVLAAVYFLARVFGKVGGAWLGAVLANSPEKIKKYIGLGLLPQSGVAIALAYTIQKEFVSKPEVGLLVFNLLLITAALTEVVGPLATKYAIIKAGEARELSE